MITINPDDSGLETDDYQSTMLQVAEIPLLKKTAIAPQRALSPQADGCRGNPRFAHQFRHIQVLAPLILISLE
jgi:hypothetical protein